MHKLSRAPNPADLQEDRINAPTGYPCGTVYYGIFSRKTARLLRSYDSKDDTVAALRSALRAAPEARSSLAVMQFDEDGSCLQEWSDNGLGDLLAESAVGSI